jgi:peptidoglycan/xylan/chitin deacetylase (PgdA/CDA1 family)
MRFVSPLLKHAVYPALHRTGWLNRIPPIGGYGVVNYHGLLPADPSHDSSDVEKFLDGPLVDSQTFRKHLQFLKTHYRVIHPEDFRASIEHQKPLPPRSVLVTCDDGLRNNLTEMLPILQSEDVPCLFFVTAASCRDDPGMLWYHELYYLMRNRALENLDLRPPLEDGPLPVSSQNLQSEWWSTLRRASQLDAEARASWMALVRTQCGPPPAPSQQRWRLMNTRDLKQLSAAGMTIGAHTRTHPILSLCSDEEARREIQESKIEIERALGRPVWAFAYPFGNPDTMGQRGFRLAEEAGFSCAFLNVESWREPRSESRREPGHENGAAQRPGRFALPRTHVTSDMTLPEYAAHLSGFHTRLQRAVGA